MLSFDRIRRAILHGAFFFAAAWIIDDLRAGIGTDRAWRYLTMAVLFAIFFEPAFNFISYRQRKLIGGRSLRLDEIMGEIRRIIRTDKQPTDPSGKS